MLWTVVVIVLAVLIGLVLIQSAIVRAALPMFESAPPLNAVGFQPDVRAEEFECTTADGLKLHGAVFRRREVPCRGLILFCHELGGNCWSAMSYAEGLYNAGFDLVAFDFRNHGASDALPGYQPLHWMTDYEVEDVRSVIRYIAERPDLSDLPLGVFGISRGGGAALAAAAEHPQIRCVASEGAYSLRQMTTVHAQRWLSLITGRTLGRFVPRWHVELTLWGARTASQRRRNCRYANVARSVQQLDDTPTLLMSGARDNYVQPEIARLLFDQIATRQKELWIVPGARHNQARSVDPEEYDRRLIEFFNQLTPEAEPATDQPEPVQPANAT